MVRDSFKVRGNSTDTICRQIQEKVDNRTDNVKRVFLEFGNKLDKNSTKTVEQNLKKELKHVIVTSTQSDKKKETSATIYAEETKH